MGGIVEPTERSAYGCYSYQTCCPTFLWGEGGNPNCWDNRAFNFQRCCALSHLEENEWEIPLWTETRIPITLRDYTIRSRRYLSSNTTGGRLLWLVQDVLGIRHVGPWAAYREENVPLVLWRAGYAMMRWMETLAAPPLMLFKNRRVLELGAGVGLLAVMSALGGAKQVVATDYSGEAVRLIRKNLALGLGDRAASRHVAWQMDWMNISEHIRRTADKSTSHERRAAGLSALQNHYILPPFDVVVCSALGYVKGKAFEALLCVLDLVVTKGTVLLWGGGVAGLGGGPNEFGDSPESDKHEKFKDAFNVEERMDAMHAGYTREPGFMIYKLSRRSDWEGCSLIRGWRTK